MKNKYVFIIFSLLSAFICNAQACYKEIKLGTSHGLALKADNTLWVWGNNWHYQFGNGTVDNNWNPTQIGTDTWSHITAGTLWSLGIKSNGTLWGWGRIYNGLVGNDAMGYTTIPTQIGTDNNWLQVATGTRAIFALKTNGTLWGWGYNLNGTLGDGTQLNRTTPVQIGTSTNWSKISILGTHVLALKSDGSMWTWGANDSGVFNNDTWIGNVTTPTQVGTATDWVEIAAGGRHNIAIKSNGTMWSWGDNYNGVLGNGNYIDVYAPTQIGADNTWVKVSAGSVHAIALKTNGTIWTWGINLYGEVGNGSTTNTQPFNPVINPFQVGTESNWTKIEATVGSHTLASKNDSNWTWGSNTFASLGNGQVSTNSLIPSLVVNCNMVLSNDIPVDSKTIAQVYPIPATNVLNITTSDIQSYKMELYDIQGRLVTSEEIISSEHQMNISNLTQGTYLLKLIAEDKIQTIKVVKN